MSNYNLTAIKMNVDLGSTKKVIDQYNALVKQLETKHVKLEIDVSSIQAGVGLATSEIEKAYQKMANEAKKAKEEMSKPVKFDYKNSIIDNSSIDKFRQSLAQIRTDIKDISNVKVTYGKNESGNGLGRIDSAVVTYTNNMNKLITETMAWAETTDKATNEQTRRWQTISVVVNENVKALDTLTTASEKFKANMSGKITGIEIGKDSSWATQLSQFETLKAKMEELKNFKLDSTNIQQYRSLVGEVATAYSNCKNEITRVKNEQQQLSQTNAINDKTVNKVRDFNTQLDLLRNKYKDIDSKPMFQQIVADVEKLNSTPPTQFNNSVNQINNNLRRLKSEMNGTVTMGAGLFKSLGNSIKSAFSFMTGATLVYSFANQIRQMPKTIIALDTALVDLKKTTSMNTAELEEFYRSSNDIAKSLGVTTEEIINQASAWSRLGYSTKEQAETMAEVSAIFKSISPGMDMDTATDGLVSAMKAFKIEANDALDGIASKINVVGNTQAVTNNDIIDFLTRSSSAMAEANNTLDQTIALGTAATEITRDAASVGNVLKTTSMRIRGYDEETEAYTNNVEVLSGKIADLTKTASNMGGISLFTDESKTTFKSTYQLLDEISGIYDELSDKDQADLLEVLAGKRNGQAVAAMINNFDAARKSMDSMANSQGNAMKEMEVIYDSLDYKINKLKETWVGLTQGFIERDSFKGLIDATTSVLDFIDACGGLIPVLTSVLGIFILLKKEMVATFVMGIGKSAIGAISTLIGKLGLLSQIVTSTATGTLSFKNAMYMTRTNILGLITPTQMLGATIGALTIAFGLYQSAQAKAKQKHEEYISSLKESISKSKSELDSIDELKSQYETLYNTKNRTEEQNKQILDVQDKLITSLELEKGALDASKQSWDELSGSIDKASKSKLEYAVTKQKDLVDAEKEKYENTLNNGKYKDDYLVYDVTGIGSGFNSKENEAIKELKEKLKETYKDLIIEDNEGSVYFDKTKMSTEELNEALKYTHTLMQGMPELNKDKYENFSKSVGKVTDAYDSYTEALKVQYDLQAKSDMFEMGISKKDIENATDEQLASIKKSFAELNKSEDPRYIEYFYDMIAATKENKTQLDNMSNSTDGVALSWDSVSNTFKSLTSETDLLVLAQQELLSTMSLTPETIQKLAEKYPQLANSIGSWQEALFAINKELNNQKIDKYADDISELNDTIEKVKDGQQLSGKEITDLVEKYPQLQSAITNVNGVYGLELTALENLTSSMTTNTKKALEDEAKKTQQVIANTRARMQAYLQEKKAYSALSGMTFNEDGTISDSGEFTAKMSQDKNLQKIYNEYNSYLQMYADIEKQIQNIDILGQDGGSKSSKSTSYIEQGFADRLNLIKIARENLADEISKLQSQIDIAVTKHGESEYVQKLRDQLSGLREEEKNLIKSSTDELRKLRDESFAALTNGNNLFDGVKAEDLNDVIVDQASRQMDKTIQSLGDSAKGKALEKNKARIEEMASAIIAMNEEIKNSGDEFFSNKKAFIDEYITKINEAISAMESLSDERESEISLKLSVLDEGDEGYIDGVKQLQQEALDIKVKKSEEYKNEYVKLLNVIGNAESKCLKDIKSKWIQNEAEILEIRKQTNEKYIAYMQNQMSGVTDYRDALVEMYKYNDDLAKDALDKQKDALENEADLRKEALEARKDELDAIKEEYDYQNKINDLRKSLSYTMSDLNALEFDDSAEAIQSKIELMNKAEEQKQALADEILNKSIEDAKKSIDDAISAIDKQTEVQVALLEAQIASLNRTDKEYKDMAESAMVANPEGTTELLLQYAKETGTMYAAEVKKLSDAVMPVLTEIKNKDITVMDKLSSFADNIYALEKENTNLGVSMFDGTSLSGNGSEYIQSNILNSNTVTSLVTPLLSGMKDIFNGIISTPNNITIDPQFTVYAEGNVDNATLNEAKKWFSSSMVKVIENTVESALRIKTRNIAGATK